MAAYIDADALKKTLEETLGKAFDEAVTELAADQPKLKEFVEAVKLEVDAEGLSELAAKVEAELQKLGGGGGGAGGGSAGGGGGGASSGEGGGEPASGEAEQHHEADAPHDSGGGSGEGGAEEYA